jgi:glycosyltransferase involved in cell wall biosynthesis
LITIVLPTYNGVNFLSDQLESIFNQTYKNFSLIVIDDNSSDNTIEFVIEIFKKHNFTNYKISKNEQNLGPTKTFEIGVSMVTTKYIAFCDQDDIWFDRKLEYYLDVISKDQYDLVYSASYIMNGNEKTKEIFPKNKIYKTILGELSNNKARGATILLSTELAKKLIPYYDLYDKWIFIISIYIGKVKYIDTPLHYYRIHSTNVNGGTYRKRDTKSLIEVQENNKLFYTKMHSYLTKAENIEDTKKVKILDSINDLIKIFDLILKSIKTKNKLKTLIWYFKHLAFIELSLIEKVIYFYYMVLKFK